MSHPSAARRLARRIERWLAAHVPAREQQRMISPAEALPGRSEAVRTTTAAHVVLGTPLLAPLPDGFEEAIFAMGCFWGAERWFWEVPGVYTTAVGYCGGFTPNPSYDEVCTARTGHAESVLVVFDPAKTSYVTLLAAFFEGHNPTQHMRQGNDVGTQYRSAIFPTGAAQAAAASAMRARYAALLQAAGFGPVETEIAPAGPFYAAEDYHQQYLAKHPWGYCGLGSTGIRCPIDDLATPSFDPRA